MLPRLCRFLALCLALILFAHGPMNAQEAPAVITPANAANLALLAEAPISDFGMPQLAWTSDGGLAVGMFDGMYVSTGSVRFMPAWRGAGTAIETLPGVEADGIYDLAANPVAPQLAIGTRSKILLYDLNTRATTLTIDHLAVVLAYSPDGRLLAFRDTDSVVRVWDVTTNRPVAEFTVPAATGLAFSPDGAALAIGNIEGDVYRWDVASHQGRWLRRADAPEHGPGGGGSPDQSISFSPDGRFLTSVSFWEFGQVRLWDVAAEQVDVLLSPLPHVSASLLFDATAFSPASDLAAITGGQSQNTNDGIYLWSLADAAAATERMTSNWLAQLPHHAVSSVAFSPDGRLVASAGGGVLRLWALDVPAQADLAAAHEANIVAYCQALGEAPAPVPQGQGVGVVWSWYATTPELLADHMSSARYDVRLDGEPLDGWRHLSQPLPDPANDGHWTVYYYVGTPNLTPGQHEVEYFLTWDYAISDGLADFGPETATPEDSGRCTFEVR